MMRNKGSYWQVAEISNLPKVIYDIAELQKTFPYRNRYVAVLYIVDSIKDVSSRVLAFADAATDKHASPKASALAGIATELAKTGKSEKAEVVFSEAIEISGSINNAEAKAWALVSIATELAKAGKSEKAIELAGSIKGAFPKAAVLWNIVTELAKLKTKDKQEDAEIANSIMTALNR